MADVHGASGFCGASSAAADKTQLFVFAGDATSQGCAHETEWFMSCLEGRKVVLEAGNHDLCGTFTKNTNATANEAVRIGNVEFLVLQIHQKDAFTNTRVDPALMEGAFAFLDEHLATDDPEIEHRFVVVHTPVYSTGEFGSDELFTPRFEQFIDAHGQSRIRAVLTGHDHVFAVFKRNGVYYKLTGSGGAKLDAVHRLGSRSWPSEVLEGPLEGDGSAKSMGYEYHVYSKPANTKTQVFLTKQSIRYVATDLATGEVVWSDT